MSERLVRSYAQVTASTHRTCPVPSGGQGPLLLGASETSPQTQRPTDEEERRIVDNAHAEVTHLLTYHGAQIDRLARALLRAETLDEPDAYAAPGIPTRAHELEATA